MSYWDTSALIKLYVTETDSGDYLDLAAGEATPPAASELARVEMLAALYRKEARGDLLPGQAREIHARFVADLAAARVVTLPTGPASFREAVRVVECAYASHPPVPIRGLDALHLGIALAESVPSLVSADTRQRDVAAMMGLIIQP